MSNSSIWTSILPNAAPHYLNLITGELFIGRKALLEQIKIDGINDYRYRYIGDNLAGLVIEFNFNNRQWEIYVHNTKQSIIRIPDRFWDQCIVAQTIRQFSEA